MPDRRRVARLSLVMMTSAVLLGTGAKAGIGAANAPPDPSEAPAAVAAGLPRVLLMRSSSVEQATLTTTESGLTLATWTAFDSELLVRVLYSASRSSGSDEWTAAAPITPRDPSEVGISQHVVVEQRGRPMVFWRTYDGDVLSNRLGSKGRWGAPTFIASSNETTFYLEAASSRRGDLAVSFYANRRDRVVWRRPFGGSWTELPALPDTGRASGLVVGPGGVSWGAQVPDPDSGMAAAVFTWSPGRTGWAVDRVGPEPGRVWLEPWEYAPIDLLTDRRGAVAVTWPDVDAAGVVQLQFAYRGRGEFTFGPPYANPELEAWPMFGMSDDETVTAAGMGTGDRADEALVARRDPVSGAWSDPQPVLGGRVGAEVAALVVNHAGYVIVALRSETPTGGDRLDLVPCAPDQPCESSAWFPESDRTIDSVLSAGPNGTASYLFTLGGSCEICEPKEIWARALS